MKIKLLAASLASLLLLVMVFGACAKTTTVTVTANTITIPGITTTLPAVTITLPGKTTTIPATTVVIPATVTTVPTAIGSRLLPDKPSDIISHMASVVGDLTGDCVGCHGPGTTYYEYPMPPSWDANDHGSAVYTGFFYVLPGSIQDHTGRTSNMCLDCHRVVK